MGLNLFLARVLLYAGIWKPLSKNNENIMVNSLSAVADAVIFTGGIFAANARVVFTRIYLRGEQQ